MTKFLLVFGISIQLIWLTNSSPIIELDTSDAQDYLRVKRGETGTAKAPRRNLNIYSPQANGTDCIRGFCAEVENYPSEYISNLLNKLKIPKIVVLLTRGDFDDDVETLCGNFKHNLFPKIGQNRDNLTKFIINAEDYMQSVEVETCTNVNQPCKFEDRFPADYSCFCREVMASRVLLTLNSDGTPIYDHFQYPKCCMGVFSKHS